MSKPRNPYVGPRTFEESDEAYFFGRDREAQSLVSLVISEPLVLFYAKSGTGKSSLLNTKLIPGLRAEQFHVLPRGRVNGELPPDIDDVANIYVFNLLLSLTAGEQSTESLTDMTLTDYLQARKVELFLDEYYDKEEYYEAELLVAADDLPDDETWTEPPPYQLGEAIQEPARVLIIDQFEEILTTHPERWMEREDFFKQLAQAIADDSSLWVVFTMREDYIAGLDPYAPLLPGKLRTRFRLDQLKREAALKAIKQPAQIAGIPYDEGVAEAFVDNLRRIQVGSSGFQQPSGATHQYGLYVEPVHLQIVCHQLWENLPDDSTLIEAQHVQQFGDVDQALIDYYEATIKWAVGQTGVSERTLRTWIDSQLITPARTRGLVYRDKTETAGLSNLVINILHDAYIIRADVRDNNVWFELSHDRLVEPILESNEAWQETHRNPLTVATLTWLEYDKSPRKLYRGEALRQVQAYAADHATEITPIEKAFIEASVNATRRQAIRRLQLVILASVGLIIGVAGLAIYAFSSANQARVERDNAATAQVEAIANRQTAEAASTIANEQLAIAETAKVSADLQREEAEAASTQVVARQQTAEAEKAEAISVRETVIINLEQALTQEARLGQISELATTQAAVIDSLEGTVIVQAIQLAAVPTATPRPTSIIATATNTPTPTTAPPPTATPSATPNRAATATTQARKQELASFRATQTAEILSVSMVFVPRGLFTMGFVEGTESVFGLEMVVEADERPTRQVFLPDYWIDRTEVTNQAYQQCVGAGVCRRQTDGDPTYNFGAAFGRYPVIFVSWNDAQTYCQWLGRRLPTEAEWEKAARGTDNRVWAWGNVLRDNLAGPILKGNINGSPDDGPIEVQAHFAGVSPYGAYEMTGNVAEWVSDWYRATYYAERRNPDDNPQGPSESESDGRKVIRGGSFRTEPVDARVDDRNALAPSIRTFDVGFRCATSLD